MARTTFTKLELQILETLWNRGPCPIREIQEALPESSRPVYTTVQAAVYRLENRGALRCVKRISNANIFEASISRDDVGYRMIDELFALFGGGTKPVMAHLIESGKVTLDDVKEAEQVLRKLARKQKTQ
jgi:predicted transcriptional regulator